MNQIMKTQNLLILLLSTLTMGLIAQPNPPTNVTATPSSIYAGQTSNLKATSAGNYINWYTVPTGGTAIGSIASGENFPVAPTIETTYYAEAESPSVTSSLQIANTHNYGANGVFLSVTPNDEACEIDGFPFIGNTTGTYTVKVYYRVGEYSGFETNSGAWTHLGDFSTYATGLAEGFVDIPNLTIPANTKYSFYLYSSGSIFLIKSSNVTVSDDRIEVSAGSNVNGLFTGYVYTGMSLRGSVRYVEAVGSVSVTRTPVTVSILTDMVWTGAVSTDWKNGSNWNSGIVPTESINVNIPVTSNNPVIDWMGGVCNDLTIESGASLAADGGALITYGTVTNNGSFSINVMMATDLWELIGVPVSDVTADLFMGNYLQMYSESSDTWNEIIEPTTPLMPGAGYALWMQSKSGLFTYSGTPNTGDYSVDYTYTPAGNPLHYGFNLVGNPYPSYIDWNEMNATYGAVYQYDGYSYTSWNGTGWAARFVPPGEGFLIAPGQNGTLNFTNDCRALNQPAKSANAEDNTIVLKAGNDFYKDKLYIVFNENATEGFDLQYDAWKLLTEEDHVGQLFTINDDQNYSIDQRPECEQLSMGFTCQQGGSFTVSIESNTIGGVIYLEDLKTGTVHNLSTSAYTFDWSISEENHRFNLHFGPMGIDQLPEANVLVYAAGNVLHINTPNQQKLSVNVYNLVGQHVLTQTLSKSSNSIPLELESGIYIVTVGNGSVVETQKIYIR